MRPLDRRAFAAEIARVKDVYHSAWQHNWGFSPMTDGEFDHLAATLRPVLDPDLVRIAEVHGHPAGFALLVPDANQAIRAARGRLTTCGLPLGLVRMLRAARTIRRARAVAVGVKERYRGRGLEVLFYVDLLRAAHQRGYTEIDISWILEDNHAANRAVAALGATRTKTHRIYRLDDAPCASC